MRDPDPVVRHLGLLAATLLLAVAITTNEIVSAVWRAERDRALGALVRDPLSPRTKNYYQHQADRAAAAAQSTRRSPMRDERDERKDLVGYLAGGVVILVSAVSGVAAAFVNTATATVTLAVATPPHEPKVVAEARRVAASAMDRVAEQGAISSKAFRPPQDRDR